MSSHRKTGFLRPKERRLLFDKGIYPEASDIDPPARPSQTRSELKSILDPSTFEKLIVDFAVDLGALTLWQLRDKNRERMMFEVVIGNNIEQLKRARNILTLLIAIGEDQREFHQAVEFSQALDELWVGPDPIGLFGNEKSIDEIKEKPPGELTYRDFLQEPDLDEWEGSEWVVDGYSFQDMMVEREYRRACLRKVLEKPGCIDIIEYLSERGKTVLPEKKIQEGGEPWRRVASRELHDSMVDREEISNRRTEFEINERGEAVLRAWDALKNTSVVKLQREVNPDAEVREIVFSQWEDYFLDNTVPYDEFVKKLADF